MISGLYFLLSSSRKRGSISAVRARWIPAFAGMTMLLCMTIAHAQTAPAANASPVNITADALEYHDADHTYIARGNAEVVQGNVTIKAGVLTAHYVEDAEGKTNITQVVAEGGVTILSGEQTITGERGIYDVGRKVAVLRGGNLRFSSGADEVTARDTLEYWEGERLAVARGNALAIRADRRVAADVLTAVLEENTANHNALEVRRLAGEGSVLISTPTEIVRGNKGLYDVKRQLATLDGNVQITRGPNQLNGARAEVNMATGVSRLLAGSGQRVRGLVIPKDAPVVP